MSRRAASNKGNRRRPEAPAPTLVEFLRRRRRRKLLITVISLLTLGLLIGADHAGWLLYDGGDWARYHGRKFEVLRVIDGDTLVLAAEDPLHESAETHVRLWGIDAPEVAHPDYGKSSADLFGNEARDEARRLSHRQRVRLELQPDSMRDHYDRLLAYVQLPDGTWLNERLLTIGLAEADPRFPHRWSTRYELIEDQARRDSVGLWATPQP